MLARLLFQRARHERGERNPGTERSPEIDLVVAEKTGPEPAVRGKAHPVARGTIRMRNRCYNTYRSQPGAR